MVVAMLEVATFGTGRRRIDAAEPLQTAAVSGEKYVFCTTPTWI
jgi:hypothetical protein